MKKRGFILLVISLTAIFLTSCVGRSKETKNSNSKQKNQKQIIVGYDLYEPYAYINEKGKISGSDIEIAKEAFRRMGYQPVFKKITWGSQKALLKNKDIDCIWCGFSIDGREKQYQWTKPYLNCYQKVVVRSDSGIKQLSDLRGKNIAVQVDTKTEEYFLKQEASGKLQIQQLSTYKTLMDAIAAFNKGYADAVAAHEETLRYYVKGNEKAYRFLDTAILKTHLAVAFDQNYDKQTVAKLSSTLDDMIQDGTIKKIVSKYGVESRQLVEDKTGDQ